MHVIFARNVNDAYAQGIQFIHDNAKPRPSRYGDVLEIPGPVSTVYSKPIERVLFDPHRNINPFFHLFEALWILAGRNDAQWVVNFAGKMGEFSDNGKTFHGAYGKRLRDWAARWEGDLYMDGLDQLEKVILLLKQDPETRRAVVSIYDPELDLGTNSKDIPCNDTIKFEGRDGVLNMIVFCRSNDMIWGAYGTNAVQFGFLLEYVAGMTGMSVGTYTQISCNYHVYTAVWDKLDPMNWPLKLDAYRAFNLATYPLVTVPVAFDKELEAFFRWAEAEDDTQETWMNGFFPGVAMPLFSAWRMYKMGGNIETAIRQASLCKAADWNTACVAWLQRAHSKAAAKRGDK
jgi:hypothetical protein